LKLLNALFSHAWLALRFKHNGEGLPTGFPAACALAMLYVILSAANKSLSESLDFQTLFGLSFVAHCYLFGLRNQLVGLLLLIGVLCNAMALATIYLTGYSAEKIMAITLMEYAMIFSAIINVIKREMAL